MRRGKQLFPRLLVSPAPALPPPLPCQGFESTGKADAYDDRIFALSALISQVRCVCRVRC